MTPAAPSTSPPAIAGAPHRHPDAPAPGTRIPSNYASCFGCGERHPTGLHLAVSAGAGVAVTAALLVTADHQGAPGLAHGGLLAAACDEALGSVVWLLRTPAVAGRLETDFLAPVPVGSRLHISARCTGVSGRKVWTAAEGRLGVPDGPVAVRATALFVGVDMAHFARHGRPEDVVAARRDEDVHPRTRDAFEVGP